ncbi:CvfD/Ygs/GSP13 family RNA-binding post-transcriptional regulator [Furfurilactobacillus sp. WILCCON 0119]|uniref:CvfD/Ygs/GSP13 family RNA-binding post-transcriptional regulator n=1 Tax=Furfurilactobacillus entadae TaxID=2922307 RepID=UPI0035E586D7
MEYRIGQIVKGTVTGIQPYGAFVNLDEDHQGLIHISEMHVGFVSDMRAFLKVGESVTVKVLDIDEYSGKISLSIRCLEEDAQERTPGINPRQQHKRYWTTRHVRTGFTPIEEQMPAWLAEARQRFLTIR